MLEDAPPVFRFAPSPNGLLHLGHAYSAIVNQRLCQEMSGAMLLRIEDIDTIRCTPELEELMLEDLKWLGFNWHTTPIRQSQNFETYADTLDTLCEAGLAYPAFMTRGEIKKAIRDKRDSGEHWNFDPDGVPHYPGNERDWSSSRQENERKNVPNHTWRLNMKAALDHVGGTLVWQETGRRPDGETGEILADPAAWGDVILARSDTPTSYHLSAVVDDARQRVTHVVRGRDLYHATSVHRLLQTLLGLPVPTYHHHDLVMGDDGRKLSKSQGDTSLRSLRLGGMTPPDILRLVGL